MNQDYKPGILSFITNYISYFMMITLYFAISLMPSMIWLYTLEASLLSLLPIILMGPSITALLCCMQKFKTTDFQKEDLPDLGDFIKFYKTNFKESLKIFSPYSAIMIILYTNIRYYQGSPFMVSVITVISIIGSLILTLCVTNMLIINTKYKFVIKDLFKLSMFYLFAHIRSTISIGVVYFLSIAVVMFLSEILILMFSSVVGFLFIHYSGKTFKDIEENFIEKNVCEISNYKEVKNNELLR